MRKGDERRLGLGAANSSCAHEVCRRSGLALAVSLVLTFAASCSTTHVTTVSCTTGLVGSLVNHDLVLVYGEVINPGTYSVAEDRNLLGVVSRAGGFSEGAFLRRINVMRGEQLLEFDAREPFEGRGPDFCLMPGDVVYVPESLFARDLREALEQAAGEAE